MSGVALIYLLMHMLWFPQRMLGEGAKVRTKAAADADLLIEGVIRQQKENVRHAKRALQLAKMKKEKQSLIAQVLTVTAEVLLVQSRRMKGNYPSRYTCKNCGVNSPVVDFIQTRRHGDVL